MYIADMDYLCSLSVQTAADKLTAIIMRKSVLFGLVLSLSVCIPAGARDTISLVGRGWYVTRDTAAEWRNDPLFLPGEYESISDLPYNPPTFGWQKLYAKANAVSVSVPGTLEEYFTTSVQPQPTDQSGVSTGNFCAETSQGRTGDFTFRLCSPPCRGIHRFYSRWI